MSVAFRREGDDEHLEPKFELPIPPGPNWVTEEGLLHIRAQVERVKALLLTLTDETQIKAAKRDLRYWDTRHATAEVMPVPTGDTVAFGVRVTFALNGQRRTIRIVGDDEADPANGFVSFSAPLSRALMGAEVGEMLPFNGQDDAIEVLAIE